MRNKAGAVTLRLVCKATVTLFTCNVFTCLAGVFPEVRYQQRMLLGLAMCSGQVALVYLVRTIQITPRPVMRFVCNRLKPVVK